MLARSGPLGSLCAHTQGQGIVEKSANWAHQSAMQIVKMALAGRGGFVSSAEGWRARSGCTGEELRLLFGHRGGAGGYC